METYKTFLRSATNFRELANNPKTEVETGLSFAEALEQCNEYNANRSQSEIENGTKLEFEAE